MFIAKAAQLTEVSAVDLEPVLDEQELLDLQAKVGEVQVAVKLADYLLNLADETRRSADFVLGISTRGVQSLYRATQAMALCEGRSYAIPDDVQRLAPAVLAHRVVLKGGDSGLSATREAVRRVIARTAVPV